MVISPLLSDIRQKAMITPASPLLTTLVHISPSYWKFFVRLKLFSKWELSTGLDFISSVLYPGVGKLVKWHCFLQKTKNTSELQNQFVVSIKIVW